MVKDQIFHIHLNKPRNRRFTTLLQGFFRFFFLCLTSALGAVNAVSASSDTVPSNSLKEKASLVEFVAEFKKQSGLLDIYYDSNKGNVYLAIPKTGSEYIFQTSLPRGVGSNDIGLDRGQLGETRLVEFVRLGNKVLLQQKNTMYRASAVNPAEQLSIDEAFADSVLAGFKVVAESSSHTLIDYTPYLFTDVHGIKIRLSRTKQGSFSVDKSLSAVYPERTKNFELNTELEALVTFTGSGAGKYVRQVTPDPSSITVHLHHSYIALPDDSYTPRAFHPMSGFWEHSYYDYSAPITENIEQQVIVRHRLNKKDPTAVKSEAVEPIVYYLDPGIPEPVFSALKEGALWWNQAFDAIGYDNAFQVEVLPPDADPMDVKYNVIQWVHRATRGWSYGTSVVDPRTGELIKGHVTLGSLRVRQDYLIALGLTSPFTSSDADISQQKQMALDRIKQLSAHEVGHTLGLAHNFAASESNRASVMDYPHPKIEIKNGKLSLEKAYAKDIGDWDKLTIAYGYQDYVNKEEESAGLISAIHSIHSSGIAYKSDPDSRANRHATSNGHLWDNGADPIKEFDHLSNVRRIALERMGVNTLKTGENISRLTHRLVPVYLLHRYQLDALAKQLGGIEYSYERKRDEVPIKGVNVVAGSVQSQALDRLIMASTSEYLRLPSNITQLIPPLTYGDQPSREDFASRMGRVFDPITAAESAAFTSLNMVLHPQRLSRLAMQHAQENSIPSVEQAAINILNTHWMKADFSSDPLKQRLRYVALHTFFNVMEDESMAPDVYASLQSSLYQFEQWLRDKAKRAGYPKQEVAVLLRHFDAYWKTGIWPVKYQPQSMPPGSPI